MAPDNRVLIVVIGSLTMIHVVKSSCPPLEQKRGVELNCEIPDSKTIIDCADINMPIGTQAEYECEPHFINPDGETNGGELVCSPQGRWLKFNKYQEFSCSPGKNFMSFIYAIFINF